jgi:hypothetical protein
MNKLVYYGSEEIVENPSFGKGNPSNDYGLGFYVTEDKQAAKLWANKNGHSGFVNSYSFEDEGLRKLILTNDTELDVLRWITILVSHRFSFEDRERFANRISVLEKNFGLSLKEYDYIEGYRADDNYFAYSRDFVAGALPFEILKKAMSLGRLGKQIALISPKAFKAIHFKSSDPVEAGDSYERLKKETNAEYRLLKQEANDNMRYIQDLLRTYTHD